MKYDIVLASVGGQGGLSIATVIATAATEDGLSVRQSEVHGMSQRGGAVVANLRLSDRPVASPLISVGGGSMILSMEPLESLRYLQYLSPEGCLVVANKPVLNIPDYPEIEKVYEAIRSFPKSTLVDSERLGREVGSARASNMVMVGVASKKLPIRPETLEKAISSLFARKGERIVDINLKAFRAGRALE